MIVRFFRFLGTALFSCCDHDNDWDRLQYTRATPNRSYHYQYNSYNESDRLQNHYQRQNHYQCDDNSIKANLLAPSPSPKLNSDASFGSLARSNTKSNSPRSSHPTIALDASSNSSLLFNPTPKVVSGRIQIKPPFEQSDVKLNISTSSFPSKPVSSSSPQRPDVVSFVQSDIKSNTSTSSFSTKTVQSSSPLRADATSLPNNFTTIPARPKPKVVSGRMQIKPPFEQSDVKLNISTSSFPSKPVSSSSPQRPDVVSFVQSDIKSNTSTSSFSTKTVQSSSPLRPDATSLPNNFTTKPATDSFMQWVVKSNLPKNSQDSKSIPALSPIQKTASPPICSTRQTITSPFMQSVAELNASITSASSKAGPGPSEIEDPKEDGKGGTQRYEIPKHIEEMIKNDIVPPVLKMPLSPDTYADYFAALLYAEDFYCEKWSAYLLKDVVLELREKKNPGLQDQSDKKKSKNGSGSKTQKNYPFVAFEINEVPERRPFLLSRDHVHLRPVDKGRDFEPFHGVLFRVERGTTILAEFKDDFHKQHKPSKRYDISFSFNRVCLKRAHRAVSATTNPLLCKILFPNPTSLPTQWGQVSPIDQILNHKLAPIPYLIEGPLCRRSTRPGEECPNMRILIKDIVLKIYESCKESRVLICAPQNKTCDALVRLIMEKVCENDIFRANAAFRDKELVPDDIMPACIFRGECFTCPPLDELERFRIITSTFVSTFRLYNAGLKAGHFSHIFLLDASSAIEPEMIVALVDLVSEETVAVVTGSVQDQPYWVRSDIGRYHGLRESFFERLRTSEPYWSDNPLLITHI